MIPRLYESTETAFTTFGICPLGEATSCIVTEERNGQYVLNMDYPTDGMFFDEIKVDRIILAMAHENDVQAQPFRIESISGDMGGIVTIEAVHVSYQLNWSLAARQTIASGTAQANMRAVGLIDEMNNKFTFYSDIATTKAITVNEPVPFRSLLGGIEGSFLDTYGGEFEWDRYDVHLWSARGQDNVVRITYGKNLTGLDWETDVSDSWTAVHAYWMQEQDGVTTYVYSDIQEVASDFAFRRLIAIDASGDFQSQPTVAQMNSYAQQYVNANAADPVVSVTVDFVPLWQTEEYKEFAEFEKVNLCDTVTIVYPPLNLELKAKVVKTVYNTLLDRYDSIEIKTAKQSLANTIWALDEQTKPLRIKASNRNRLRRIQP